MKVIKNLTLDKTDFDFAIFSEIFNTELRCATSSDSTSITHYHYCRTLDFKYWDSQVGQDYKKYLIFLVNKFNQLSRNHIAEIVNFSDYEMEIDRDRSWPASYGIYFKKK